MSEFDLAALTGRVLWAAFGLGALFGAIAQRTHFCTMGAIGDVLSMGDWSRMRQWALAAGVAIIGFSLLAWAGLIDPTQTLHASSRWLWLSALVGGLLFGFGMVLASGCGSKTLVRVGSGNLKALIVMLVLGLAAYATLKGITAVARVATVDRVAVEFSTQASLPYLLAAAMGWPVRSTSLLLGLLLGGALSAWAVARSTGHERASLLGGAGIGALVVGMWWVSGNLGFVAEHPQTLGPVFVASGSGRAEAMSFVAPIAYMLDWLILFSDRNNVLTLSVAVVAGVIAGSAGMALARGTFRWEGFGGTEDVANHLIGAVLMGVGGVTAMGCTIGQGLSGLSTLSLTSLVAVGAITGGAVLAFRYQMWRLERMA